MADRNNHNKFRELRSKYEVFEYRSYSYTLYNDKISIVYCFRFGENFILEPKIEIPSRNFLHFKNNPLIDNIVFNIGMVELISYWKAACPPRVKILCGKLSDKQINWWKKLYFNGLGEFFYLNGIDTDISTFMEIESDGIFHAKSEHVDLSDAVLVPIGGGKDSVVSMEILIDQGYEVVPMIVNPREASVRTIETGGFKLENCAVVKRFIDKKLLQLNNLGFLNGHTPFSRVAGFC